MDYVRKPAVAGFFKVGLMAFENKLSKFKLQQDRAISAQIYDFLRLEIITTHIKPGSTISENELSTHFQVSRQPVREALMRLRLDGLLKVIPQRGSIVQKISVSNLKQICFIRTSLECAALDHARELSLTEIEKIIDKLALNIFSQEKLFSLKPQELTEQFLRLDDEFHRLICSFSQCPMAFETIQALKPQMDRVRFLSQGGISPYEEIIAEHKKVFEALKDHDFTKAKKFLIHHLHEILKTYIPIRKQYSAWFLTEDEEDLL